MDPEARLSAAGAQAARGRPGPLLPAPRPRGARLAARVARLGWGAPAAWAPRPRGLAGGAPPAVRRGLRSLRRTGCPTSFRTGPLRSREGGWEGPVPGHLCVWGGKGVWAPAYPSRAEKVRLHFLPFPQEGTHTPLNLTPKAAASRPGVAEAELGPAAPRTAAGPGFRDGAGGCAAAGSAPGCSPPGRRPSGRCDSPLPCRGRPRAAPEPGALRRRPPPGSPRCLHPRSAGGSRGGGGARQAGPGPGRPGESRGGGPSGLQQGAEASPQEARISFAGSGGGGAGTPSPPSPGLEPPPLPRPHGEEEGRPAVAGEAGQAGAGPGSDPRSPALRLRPRAAASLRPRSLPPLPHGVPGPTSALPAGYPLPSFSRPTPSLCSGLWGWARDVKPVWRRRDWPARAIKRATSSFPITHCQSGNRGGPAGN